MKFYNTKNLELMEKRIRDLELALHAKSEDLRHLTDDYRRLNSTINSILGALNLKSIYTPGKIELVKNT